jgi:hypothetical protein
LVLNETVGGLKGYSLGSTTSILNLPFCEKVSIVSQLSRDGRVTHGVDRVLRALHDDLPEKDIALFGELHLSARHRVVRHLAKFLSAALVVNECA